MTFEVRWYVAADEWQQLRQEQDNPVYNNEIVARIDLLDGPVQFFADGTRLFTTELLPHNSEQAERDTELVDERGDGPEGFLHQAVEISVIDIGYGLARVLRAFDAESIPHGASALFSAADSGLEITFTRLEGRVRIMANRFYEYPGYFIETPEPEFRAGVGRFLNELLSGVARWAPNALKWPVFATMKPYAGQ